ncbi:MAG TPA: VanZ family protein [Casimicrobiaceae bacterium]|nr:VanZ family protein [Casimicrobiaceae bacterium]
MRPSGARWGLASLAYAALVVYGSLYPFSGWTIEGLRLFSFLAAGWHEHLSRADVVTNLLAYMPLGLLLVRWLRGHGCRLRVAMAVAIALGSSLSFAMESLQQFIPSRIASVSDLVANTLGTVVGASLAGVMHSESLPWAVAMRYRERWFRPGRLVDLGLIAIGLWALSQLTPLVPSLDLGNLRHGLSPIWQTLQHPGRFNFAQWATYVLYLSGLALLAAMLGAPGQSAFARFFAFVACVLASKIVIVTRQLSLEAATGALCALLVASPLLRLSRGAIAAVSALLILCGFTVAEVDSDPAGALYPFNWVPFAGHLENPLIGIASILEEIWPAAALAALARLASPPRLRRMFVWAGFAAIACFAFGLEWYQQYLPGRVGDFTVVLLVAGAWFLIWSIPAGEPGMARPEPEAQAAPQGGRRTWVIAATFGVAALTTAGGILLGRGRQAELRVDESKLPRLPAPEQLPPVSLPSFRHAHPRLPSPSSADLLIVAVRNPGFVREMQRRGGGGRGELEAAVTQEILEPGSVDLELLYARLVALKFDWRGHQQGKPLALAYDWLYSRWSEGQRAALREKLVEGCGYLIERIRRERLSPYNVILYNAPLQALMACSLSLYGDDPRGEAPMRFTYDLWKNRVLPVWRQIMGSHGGWHEGGEYVGIGIGQAIYQLPAMWRSATGEDLFASEPGLRGFLDFLVYRRRPDGTDFHWGDASAFDREVPDAIALALEFRHAAAYSLRPPAAAPAPTSWPWGPLTDASLYDPQAQTRLPLVRRFDGLGMIVARSDWSPDATYVTFKAGDNYWSHSHLDQGAFTIYKGGSLAIDSGIYGPVYGSDHHMNYTYQSIAHNLVTVTDSADTESGPGKDKPRSIANDGGQRRIGSGWGVEAAPLDRVEWSAKRDIYHTGEMGEVLDHGGLVVAAADITPAYTNSSSGEGTFSARTRRVERFWRIFGYDRVDDVVVIFDQVQATSSALRKRWLLHTLARPTVFREGFTVEVASADLPGHGGGRLEARVLLPRNAVINPIGGHGLEFFVDDRNYDENGTLGATRKPKDGVEAGAWRVEVSPPRDEKDDIFLVVLLPTSGSAMPVHRVTLLELGNRVGCEIVGPNRTTRWWFEPGRNAAAIDFTSGTDGHHYVITGPEQPVAPASLLARIRGLFRSRI